VHVTHQMYLIYTACITDCVCQRISKVYLLTYLLTYSLVESAANETSVVQGVYCVVIGTDVRDVSIICPVTNIASNLLVLLRFN